MKSFAVFVFFCVVICSSARRFPALEDNRTPPSDDIKGDAKSYVFEEQKRTLAKHAGGAASRKINKKDAFDLPEDVRNDQALMKESHKLRYYGIRIGAREECSPTCKRQQLCMIDTTVDKSKCISKHKLKSKGKYYLSKFALRWKRRLRNKRKRKDKKLMAVKSNDVDVLSKNAPDTTTYQEYMKSKTEKMKERKKAFENKIKKTLPTVEDSNSKKEEEEDDSDQVENILVPGQDGKSCTKQQLDDMGRRLLDWFKHLQDYHKKHPELNRRRSKGRRNKAKDLSRGGKCECLQPVSWQFSHLDINNDDRLSSKELKDVENNGYEKCVKPFIESCDQDKDSVVSGQEWCCCFAGVVPPCLTTVKNLHISAESSGPRPMPGMFIPQCDTDGFYLPEQCHSSVGQCWCVDRNGRELEKTRVRGSANCEASNAYMRG